MCGCEEIEQAAPTWSWIPDQSPQAMGMWSLWRARRRSQLVFPRFSALTVFSRRTLEPRIFPFIWYSSVSCPLNPSCIEQRFPDCPLWCEPFISSNGKKSHSSTEVDEVTSTAPSVLETFIWHNSLSDPWNRLYYPYWLGVISRSDETKQASTQRLCFLNSFYKLNLLSPI